MKNLFSALLILALVFTFPMPSYSLDHSDTDKYEKATALLKSYMDHYTDIHNSLRSNNFFKLVRSLRLLKRTGAQLEALDPPGDCGLTMIEPENKNYYAKTLVDIIMRAMNNGTFEKGFESMKESNQIGDSTNTRFKYKSVRDFLEFLTVSPFKEAFLEFAHKQPLEETVTVTYFGVFSEPELLVQRIANLVTLMSDELERTDTPDFSGPFGF